MIYLCLSITEKKFHYCEHMLELRSSNCRHVQVGDEDQTRCSAGEDCRDKTTRWTTGAKLNMTQAPNCALSRRWTVSAMPESLRLCSWANRSTVPRNSWMSQQDWTNDREWNFPSANSYCLYILYNVRKTESLLPQAASEPVRQVFCNYMKNGFGPSRISMCACTV